MSTAINRESPTIKHTRQGDFIGVSDNLLTTKAVFQVGDTIFALELLGDWPFYVGNGGSSTNEMWFMSDDCMGIPLMTARLVNDDALLTPVIVRPPVGNQVCSGACEELTVYARDPDATAISLDSFVGSWFGSNYDCDPAGLSGDFIDALPLVNLNDHFDPPLIPNFLGTPLQ